MRGSTGIKEKERLLFILEVISKNYEVLTSLNEKKKNEVMKNLDFPQRGKIKHRKLEEKIQATMINTMGKDRNLKGKLKSSNNIHFVASELIFEKSKNRVDIVGYDNKDIYLFELKKGRTKKVEQVADYVKYYSEKNKKDILRKILEHYPINPVKEFNKIKGVMVMEYAENSVGLTAWQKLAKQNQIHILFYKSALMYEAIT